jgi:vancomycin resistance protein YoaR
MQVGYRSSTHSSSKIRRTPLDFVAIFAGLLLLFLLVSVLFWQFWHANRIYSGVQVNGVPVGGLTRMEAVETLEARFLDYPTPPTTVSLNAQRFPLSAGALSAQWTPIDAVNQGYLLGREGSFSARLAQQLALALRGYNLIPEATYEAAPLRQELSEIANQVRNNDATSSKPPNLDVDVEATLAATLGALQGQGEAGAINVPLVTVARPARAPVTSEIAPLEILSGQTPTPLLLRDSIYGIKTALDPGKIQSITFTTEPLRLDEDLLRGHLEMLADQYDIAPRDARLRFNPATGGVTVMRSSQIGRQLDIGATMASVQAALADGATHADLVMAEVAPNVDSARIAEMGIRELVASGTSYFAGSSAARVRNIEVAAEKFEGVVIPPGKSFSFNRFVEDVTAANGFEDSLIIWGDRTAVGVGGGVCQVSTTIFRAAYAGGLPIEERYNHGYVVSWYGEPGLDATIYTPTVDFRFRNDTDAYMVIDPEVDSIGGSITFNLYGTRPDREITIADPVVTDRQEPAAPAYQIDEELAFGEQQQVEWPKEGMTVQVERTIVEDGTTRTDTITSYYQPWNALFLVGPGTSLPEPEAPKSEVES